MGKTGKKNKIHRRLEVEWDLLVPAHQLKGESAEETKLLRQMHAEATAYLSAFSWCARIKQSFFGKGIGGVVSVFLFKILPGDPGVDSCLWVVVGDLPPAYLVIDDAPTPASALQRYVEEMQKWVHAVKKHDLKRLSQIIPVNVKPTLTNAKGLATRLAFIRKRIIPLWQSGYRAT